MRKAASKRRGSPLRRSATPPPQAGEEKQSHGAKTRAPKAKKSGAELTAHLGPWQFKPGNCINPAGGPKTARRVLNDDFIADMQEAWKTSGKTLIERAIERYPDVFLYANAAIVPPELRSKINGLTDKDAVFGARMLAACADLKPLRETVCADGSCFWARRTSRG